jgi:hypothetical protein
LAEAEQCARAMEAERAAVTAGPAGGGEGMRWVTWLRLCGAIARECLAHPGVHSTIAVRGARITARRGGPRR